MKKQDLIDHVDSVLSGWEVDERKKTHIRDDILNYIFNKCIPQEATFLSKLGMYDNCWEE